jgi:hypothetical protein
MAPYAGVVYNLTLCLLQSRLQHIYARVYLNRMPQSTLSPSQGLWIWTLLSCWHSWASASRPMPLTSVFRHPRSIPYRIGVPLFRYRPVWHFKQSHKGTIGSWVNPFLFVKNKRLFISSEGFSTLEKNTLICYQRAILPIQ